jgi:hypothetical protein
VENQKGFQLSQQKYSILYNTTENLATDVTVKYKGQGGFGQSNLNKRKRFGIKLYKLCDSKGYTHDVVVYLVKQHENAAENVTPTHGTVLKLIRKVEGVGHKFLMKITV